MNEKKLQIELEKILTPDRINRIKQVISQRIKSVTVVLESIHKGFNQSAILRTCEAFGLLNVHVIESDQTPFSPSSSISQGAHKWLNIHRYRDPLEAIRRVRAEGFQLWASYLHADAVPLSQIDFSKPVALLFGNELNGVSPSLLPHCDGNFVIPMYGFAESFNVNVSVGIALYEATTRRREYLDRPGDLSPEEMEQLYFDYLQRSGGDKLVSRLIKKLSEE